MKGRGKKFDSRNEEEYGLFLKIVGGTRSEIPNTEDAKQTK
jgi:hypothetical protein